MAVAGVVPATALKDPPQAELILRIKIQNQNRTRRRERALRQKRLSKDHYRQIEYESWAQTSTTSDPTAQTTLRPSRELDCHRCHGIVGVCMVLRLE